MDIVSMNWPTGLLTGQGVQTSAKTLGQIRPCFYDQDSAHRLSADLEIYRVQFYTPVEEGTEGGLFWGNTTVHPGRVGDEFFMTKGHFHRLRDRAEYYAALHGDGALLLMGEGGETRCETMSPGSVHYIPGYTAHRVVNTGRTPLIFMACWPSDAGYDYETIEREGFGARMLERNGKPVLVPRG